MAGIVKHSMGNWRKRQLMKGLRASRTYSKKCRTYKAYPPATGWPGGTNYAANGLKNKGAK